MNYTEARQTAVMDSECYKNYWSIAFQCVDTKRTKLFEKWNDSELDRVGIAKVLKNWRVVTFNGYKYDLCMIALAMSGATNGELKAASDTIIMADMKPWQFYEHYNVNLPAWIDHVDLMEVSPGAAAMPSLKIYAGRLHYPTMRDLPFNPDDAITSEKRDAMVAYLDNDLGVTRTFYHELKPGIDLRCEMSDQYGLDLRSKSDAQIAEAVIKTEIERLTKKRVYKPDVKPRTFKYTPPAHIKFQTPILQAMLQTVLDSSFVVNHKGVVEMPPALADLEIAIGDSVYRMGLGGLHSSESSVCYISDEVFTLKDRDATSFYPSMILLHEWFPKHLGPVFLKVYRSIYVTRLAAKVRAATLPDKIAELEARIKELESEQ